MVDRDLFSDSSKILLVMSLMGSTSCIAEQDALTMDLKAAATEKTTETLVVNDNVDPLLQDNYNQTRQPTRPENAKTLTPTLVDTPHPSEEDIQKLTPTIKNSPLSFETEEIEREIPIESIPYREEQEIPVIEYHNPSYGIDSKSPVSMTMEMFKKQIQLLDREGFYTPNEEELLGWINKKHGLPDKSVILRIDVGVPHKDYEDAFEVLYKYGFNSIAFILSGSMKEGCSEKYICWDTLKEWMDKGVIPASHGVYHPDYKTLSAKEAIWDSQYSKKTIEEKLGREIFFFAYPYDSENHEKLLLRDYSMLFGNYPGGSANTKDFLAGTIYPYQRRGVEFDYQKFIEEIYDKSK